MSQNFVTVEGRSLKHALRPFLDVTKGWHNIPILSHVRLTAKRASLEIEGTDLDITISTSLDVIDCSGAGWSTTISARTLAAIAAVAGVMPVRIEHVIEKVKTHQSKTQTTEVAKITLGDGDAEYQINTIPAGDFPTTLNQAFDVPVETFTNGMFSTLLDKVSWCVSTEETRYYLNGVFWSFGEDRCMVATDGHRLARCRYSSDPSNAPNVIIPNKTVELLARRFAGKDVKVFRPDGDKAPALAFHCDGFVIRSKMIDGTFPDYQRVVPKESKYTFEMRRVELVDAIARASVTSTERGRALRFHERDGKVAIEQKNPDLGSARVRLSSSWPSKAMEPFGFNGSYILDIVKRCEGDLRLCGSGHGEPFTVHDADETMTRVLMPMRV